jgi:hypothetical protein
MLNAILLAKSSSFLLAFTNSSNYFIFSKSSGPCWVIDVRARFIVLIFFETSHECQKKGTKVSFHISADFVYLIQHPLKNKQTQTENKIKWHT